MSLLSRTMLKSKIHRAVVTRADVNYVGSVSIDPVLLAAADIAVGEQVHVDTSNRQVDEETAQELAASRTYVEVDGEG